MPIFEEILFSCYLQIIQFRSFYQWRHGQNSIAYFFFVTFVVYHLVFAFIDWESGKEKSRIKTIDSARSKGYFHAFRANLRTLILKHKTFTHYNNAFHAKSKRFYCMIVIPRIQTYRRQLQAKSTPWITSSEYCINYRENICTHSVSVDSNTTKHSLEWRKIVEVIFFHY